MFNRLLARVEISGFLLRSGAFLVESKEEKHSKKGSNPEEISNKRIFFGISNSATPSKVLGVFPSV